MALSPPNPIIFLPVFGGRESYIWLPLGKFYLYISNSIMLTQSRYSSPLLTLNSVIFYILFILFFVSLANFPLGVILFMPPLPIPIKKSIFIFIFHILFIFFFFSLVNFSLSRFLNLYSLIFYIPFIFFFVSLVNFPLVFIYAPPFSLPNPLYISCILYSINFLFFSPWQTFL